MRKCQRMLDGYSAALCKKITPRRKYIFSSMTNGDVKRHVEDIRLVAKEWGYSESEVDRIKRFQIRVGSQSQAPHCFHSSKGGE